MQHFTGSSTPRVIRSAGASGYANMPAAKSGECRVAGLQHTRSHGRPELPQPRQSRRDYGHRRHLGLNGGPQCEQAGHADERVLGRRRRARNRPVERPVEVRAVGRDAGRDIQQDASRVAKPPREPLRFVEIEAGTAVGRHAESVGERHAVGGVEPHGDGQLRHLRANGRDDVQQQPDAVFEWPAVAAVRACVRSEQFVEEVAVARLDVDGVESRQGRQPGGVHEPAHQSVELFIGPCLAAIRDRDGDWDRPRGARRAGRSC